MRTSGKVTGGWLAVLSAPRGRGEGGGGAEEVGVGLQAAATAEVGGGTLDREEGLQGNREKMLSAEIGRAHV